MSIPRHLPLFDPDASGHAPVGGGVAQVPAASGAAPPGTRAVTEAIRTGGIASLPGAIRRADQARYQDVTCRTALNPTRGMPFAWTLNPYRGCTHGCHYCYARRYHAHFGLGAGDDFASLILVKTNMPAVLRRELARPSWNRALVALGTATDGYQPIEGRYRLSRACLTALADARTPVSIVTKGPLVVRDVDVLQTLHQAAGCRVYVSVPTVDSDAWARLEPGTAPPLQRLRAVRTLADAGIAVGVLMCPIVPGIGSSRTQLAATVKAIADHGARFVGSGVMRLDAGTREHYLGFLAEAYPQLVEGYGRLYAGKDAAPGYRHEVEGVLAALRTRHGFT